jgi:ABC-type sugar transport system substrate-binding protein
VNRTRKLTLVLCAVLATLAIGACGSDDDGDSSAGAQAGSASGKKVTFVGPVAVPVWLQAKDGFEKKGDALGLNTTWTAPNEVDIPGIVQSLQRALTSGADGLVTCALDPKAFGPVLDQAKSQGVPIVLTDCDVPDTSQRLAFVGTIGKTFGQKSAEKLIELTGGKAGIVVMQGQFDAAIQNDILAGFKTGIADEPGMKIVSRQADNSDVAQAVQKFRDLFRTKPEIDTVYCIEAGCAGAAVTAAREAGKPLDDLTIMGTDDNPEVVDGIKKGDIEISAAQPFTKMGELAAQYLADHFAGKDVPSVTDTGVVFITKDNADTYKTEAGQ